MTTTRPVGHVSSAEAIPLRTRSFASWQARSARPTIVKAGFPVRKVGFDLDAARFEPDERMSDRASEHSSTVEGERARKCADSS